MLTCRVWFCVCQAKVLVILILTVSWSRRLYKFMSPLCFGTLVFGILIPFVTGWWGQGWLHVKLLMGLLLLAYQFYCGALLHGFEEKRNKHSHKWYRVFNEVPVLMMVVALYMVVFKPF